LCTSLFQGEGKGDAEGDGEGVEAWKLGVPRHCPGMSTSSLLTRPAQPAPKWSCTNNYSNNDNGTANSSQIQFVSVPADRASC